MVARAFVRLTRWAGLLALAAAPSACQLVGGFEDHTLAAEGNGGAAAGGFAGASNTGGAAGAAGGSGNTGPGGSGSGADNVGGQGGGQTPVGCGNGIVEANEACDDGGTESGDGCTADCQIECGGPNAQLHPDTGHCYLYNPSINLSWYAASDYCESWHGTLAAITSPDELTFLLDTYGHGTASWIGGRAESGSTSYAWETGEPFSFAIWEPGSPTPGACIVFKPQGDWYTYDCTYDGKPFFCERATGLPDG